MNKKRAIKIFILTILISIFWGFVWSWFVTRTVRKNNADNKLKNQHAIAKNIIVTETQEEKKYWEFYAKSGEYDSQNSSLKLNDIIGNFYNKNEEVIVSFKSSSGVYNEQTKKVILNGDNLFVGENGSQLYADELIWQGRDSDILANGNVQFIKDSQFSVKAKSAVFNSDLTNFKVKGNTISKIYADSETKKKYTQL